jgi:hypothetical protein
MLPTRKRCRSLFLAVAVLGMAATGVPAGTALAQTVSSVTLVWTAPGDDGVSGRATRYDLRYSVNAITGTDTLGWWHAATIVNMSAKVPSASGTLDSWVLSGLTPGVRYYAVLRTADEVPNWSTYSNVASFTLGDQTPPHQVVDLIAR